MSSQTCGFTLGIFSTPICHVKTGSFTSDTGESSGAAHACSQSFRHFGLHLAIEKNHRDGGIVALPGIGFGVGIAFADRKIDPELVGCADTIALLRAPAQDLFDGAE